MKSNQVPFNRQSIRLKGYDYSKNGVYFVTICTRNRTCMFGEIYDGKMISNDWGRIVFESWKWLEKRYDHVELDEWVIMPNHFHGIIMINDGRGGSRTAPTSKRKSLGRLIGAFKTVSTKQINKLNRTPGISVWQRNYFEHIVRDETSLHRIREYIVNNPARWEFDRENPLRNATPERSGK